MAGASKGGRDIVAYFAGHLAHLANGDDEETPGETVTVRPFHLFERVHRALAANKRYLDGLVGLWAYPPPAAADEAADFYFDQVIDRPIGGRSGESTSADRLAAFVATLGPKASAPGAAGSLWKALTGAPERRRRLPEGRPLFEYSNLILKCLDATNRPYAEVLRLGLCPREWLTGDAAVGVNTLKSTNAFLKALKAIMGDLGRRPGDAELAAAWAKAPVPGSPDAAAFARTPLGAAVLGRVAGRDATFIISFDELSDRIAETTAEAEAEPLMDGEEAGAHLGAAVAAGALAPAERDLLAAILNGRSLAETLSANPFLRRRIKADFDGDVAAFVEDLAGRAARFAAATLPGRP